jgi:hypothetical protein
VAVLKDVSVAQTARKVRDKKEDAAIAKANAMLDEMMRDGTIKDIQKAKEKLQKRQAHTQWEEMNNGNNG